MSKGCNLCDGKRSCGNWHLYAIELDTKKCLSDSNFVNKFGDDATKAYYVGKTTHTIECRYNEHSGRKKGKFQCSCFSDEPKLREKKKRVRFVKHHLTGGLRPDITLEMNPVVMIEPTMKGDEREKWASEADRFEGELADRLGEPDGHYAHWG